MNRHFAAVTSLALIVGCGPTAGNRGTGQFANTATVQSGNVVVVPAKDLLAFVLAGKYPDETVETSGTIRSVGYDSPTMSAVAISTGPGMFDLLGLPVLETNVWARLAPGQTVTLHGKKHQGNILVPFVWTVASAGPNTCPLLTSKQFAEEVERDVKMAHVRYNNHSFYLTGKVTDVQEDENKRLTVILEGTANWSPNLFIEGGYTNVVGKIKPGQTISSLCTYENPIGLEGSSGTIDLQASPIAGEFPVPGVTYGKDLPSVEEVLAVAAKQKADVAAKMREAVPIHAADVDTLRAELKDPAKQTEYNGHIIDVTGVLLRFAALDLMDSLTISGAMESEIVGCNLSDTLPWEKYVPGQRVTVRGILRNASIAPDLNDAVVIKADELGEPIPELKVSELVKIASDDEDSFNTKWKGKYIKLTGPLLASEIEQFGSTVSLNGGNDLTVSVMLGSGRHAEQIKFKDRPVGSPVRLLASVDQVFDKKIYLRDGWILMDQK